MAAGCVKFQCSRALVSTRPMHLASRHDRLDQLVLRTNTDWAVSLSTQPFNYALLAYTWTNLSTTTVTSVLHLSFKKSFSCIDIITSGTVHRYNSEQLQSYRKRKTNKKRRRKNPKPNNSRNKQTNPRPQKTKTKTTTNRQLTYVRCLCYVHIYVIQ